MAGIQISNDPTVHVTIPFPSDPLLLEEVKSINGHSKTTEIYTHVNTESIDKIEVQISRLTQYKRQISKLKGYKKQRQRGSLYNFPGLIQGQQPRMEETMISQKTRKGIISILLIAVIISLCGCATTPVPIELAPIDVDQDAKTLTPPPGKGRVYIVWPNKPWIKPGFINQLHNNQNMTADFTPATFIKWDLDPGVIVIFFRNWEYTSHLFGAFYINEGQVLFFEYRDWELDNIHTGYVPRMLYTIPNEEGLARIKSLNMTLNKDSDKREYFEWSSATCPVKSEKLGYGFYHRGNAYFQVNKFDEAIADYSRTIELTPKLTDLARLMRSLAYMCSGQKDKAESDFQQVIELSGLSMKITTTYLMAKVCDREGRFSDALTYYQSFLELNQKLRAKSEIAKAILPLSLVLGGVVGVLAVGATAAKAGVLDYQMYFPSLAGETATDLETLGQQVENRIKELQEIINKAPEATQ
jgi:tetratricopeptide (TPR) repeat protein